LLRSHGCGTLTFQSIYDNHDNSDNSNEHNDYNDHHDCDDHDDDNHSDSDDNEINNDVRDNDRSNVIKSIDMIRDKSMLNFKFYLEHHKIY
jgi:hypothetical protein